MSGHERVYSALDFHNVLTKYISNIYSSYISVEDIKEGEAEMTNVYRNVQPMSGLTKFFCFKKDSWKTLQAYENSLNQNMKT